MGGVFGSFLTNSLSTLTSLGTRFIHSLYCLCGAWMFNLAVFGMVIQGATPLTRLGRFTSWLGIDATWSSYAHEWLATRTGIIVPLTLVVIGVIALYVGWCTSGQDAESVEDLANSRSIPSLLLAFAIFVEATNGEYRLRILIIVVVLVLLCLVAKKFWPLHCGGLGGFVETLTAAWFAGSLSPVVWPLGGGQGDTKRIRITSG